MGLLCKALTYWWSTAQVYGGLCCHCIGFTHGLSSSGNGHREKNSDPISREIEQLCKGFGKTSVNS